ncbi:MAG: virulence RhuM family protein [Victivallales bacterium]|nr:virulence RhuM family protein [Victivallales bacterium]
MQILHNIRCGRPLTIYSLDVIISVGYRIKSIIGTRFRQWTTRILRDKLLASSTQNCRLMNIECPHLMRPVQGIQEFLNPCAGPDGENHTGT